MLGGMRIRQIVFAAPELAPARALLAGLLQLAPPYRDPGVAEFGLDNAVFALGDQFVEIVSPIQPDTACGRHLARLGSSGYMLIFQTDDLARERARWDAMGVRRIWNRDLDDIRASHLHPKDVGAAIVSVDEPRPAASWRWGGPDWHVAAGAAGRQRVRAITLRAQGPQAMARRWAEVLALPAPVPQGQGWRLTLDDGHVDVVADADARGDGVAGFTLAVADPDAVRRRAMAAGLPADAAGAFTLLGARIELLPVD